MSEGLAASLRSGHSLRQLAKYCIVGTIVLGINLAVYDTLIHHGLDYVLAAMCSVPVAIVSNYLLNRYWTFRDQRAGMLTQGGRFLVVQLAAIGADLVLLALLIDVIGIAKLPAQAIAIVILTPLNFLGNKLWSFGTPKLRSPA